MIRRLSIDFPVETCGSGLLLLGWCCLRLFAGCWWMLLRDVWETFGWCWEMFAKCLRDVFEWFCESCWRFFGVMSLECCWGCWRLLKDVLVLSTVSQQSLKLLSHSHSLNSLNNSFPTFSQHSHSLSNLSTVSQQSLNKHGFLLLSLNSISKLSLSLNLLSTLLFPQHSRNKPIPSSIPSSFQQNSHRPLCQVVFLNAISIRYFRKTGQYMHESLLT